MAKRIVLKKRVISLLLLSLFSIVFVSCHSNIPCAVYADTEKNCDDEPQS
jgi:hypothetical protein